MAAPELAHVAHPRPACDEEPPAKLPKIAQGGAGEGLVVPMVCEETTNLIVDPPLSAVTINGGERSEPSEASGSIAVPPRVSTSGEHVIDGDGNDTADPLVPVYCEAVKPAVEGTLKPEAGESAVVEGTTEKSTLCQNNAAGDVLTPAMENSNLRLAADLTGEVASIPRLKTSLCSYFRKSGCRHGESCRYAHGEEELKARPDGTWDPTSERAKSMKEGLPAPTVVKVLAPPAPVEEPSLDENAVVSKCIVHVPRNWTVETFKKFLSDSGVPFATAKKRKGMSVAFVGFATPNEVVDATAILDGKMVSKKRLKVADTRSRVWEKNTTGLLEKTKEESAVHDDMAEGDNDTGLDGNAVPGSLLDGEGEDLALGNEGAQTVRIRNVCDAVTPLGHLPYEEQLNMKRDEITQVLKRFARNTRKGIPAGVLLPDWLINARNQGGLPCLLEGVLASPVVDGYRNKCEFSIGCSADGKRAVGFQLGAFREGITAVAEPTGCRNVSAIASFYASAFQEFVRLSELPVWNKTHNVGFWRMLTVREGRAANGDASSDTAPIIEVMLVVQVCPTGIEEERRKAEYTKMTDMLSLAASSTSPPIPLTALLVQDHAGVSNAAPSDAPLHSLPIPRLQQKTEGIAEHIHDHISNLCFRISPTAFFQVNTLAAERLYTLAGDWVDLNEDTLLFDVCCGTGTIGLTLAHRVGLVVGIEMNESAVSDANVNAQINNITNCRFVCGKAEDVMERLLKEYLTSEDDYEEAEDDTETPECIKKDVVLPDIPLDKPEPSVSGRDQGDGADLGSFSDSVATELQEAARPGSSTEGNAEIKSGSHGESKEKKNKQRRFKNIVAIVDPPRVGLHPVVLKTIRLHTQLSRLVYISCNPQSLLANAVELCTPLSRETAEKQKGWQGRGNWKGLSSTGQARRRVKTMPPSKPFNPVKAVAVDLFPHTSHCEMVMLFER